MIEFWRINWYVSNYFLKESTPLIIDQVIDIYCFVCHCFNAVKIFGMPAIKVIKAIKAAHWTKLIGLTSHGVNVHVRNILSTKSK